MSSFGNIIKVCKMGRSTQRSINAAYDAGKSVFSIKPVKRKQNLVQRENFNRSAYNTVFSSYPVRTVFTTSIARGKCTHSSEKFLIEYFDEISDASTHWWLTHNWLGVMSNFHLVTASGKKSQWCYNLKLWKNQWYSCWNSQDMSVWFSWFNFI